MTHFLKFIVLFSCLWLPALAREQVAASDHGDSPSTPSPSSDRPWVYVDEIGKYSCAFTLGGVTDPPLMISKTRPAYRQPLAKPSVVERGGLNWEFSRYGNNFRVDAKDSQGKTVLVAAIPEGAAGKIELPNKKGTLECIPPKEKSETNGKTQIWTPRKLTDSELKEKQSRIRGNLVNRPSPKGDLSRAQALILATRTWLESTDMKGAKQINSVIGQRFNGSSFEESLKQMEGVLEQNPLVFQRYLDEVRVPFEGLKNLP